VRRALPIVQDEPLDGALLDVNVAGELCFPVARALQARGVPFVFLTGYGDTETMPEEFRATPVVGKPFENRVLIQTVSERFRRAA
jgi:DNA-binding response OmpR family regulator